MNDQRAATGAEHACSHTVDDVLSQVQDEVRHQQNKFPPFHGRHEFYGVLAEEVAEVFEEVRKKEMDPVKMCVEAMQVAAVCVRFVAEHWQEWQDSADDDMPF